MGLDESLLDLPVEQLFVRLGAEVSSDKAMFPDINELRLKGEQWFSQRKEELQSRICDERVAKLVDSKNNDKAVAVCAIADFIASCTGAASPFTVSLIIVNFGLHKFCETDGEPKAR